MSSPAILSLNKLMGHKVRNTAGEDVGKVEDLVIDHAAGCASYVIISSGGFMHLGDRLIAVPWDCIQLSQDQKDFILNTDKETLLNAPHFDRKHWPDMTNAKWRDEVRTYFAWNPAEETERAHAAEEFIEPDTHSRPVERGRDVDGLARRVEFELYATKAFDLDAIDVHSANGIVTLEGRVASRAELILAENIVKTVEGVREVKNNLRVSKAA